MVARLTRERDEALEQQTATSEILSVISRSNFKLQPVLQSVVNTAMQLCRAEQAVIYRQEEGTYRFVAGHSTVPVTWTTLPSAVPIWTWYPSIA